MHPLVAWHTEMEKKTALEISFTAQLLIQSQSNL